MSKLHGFAYKHYRLHGEAKYWKEFDMKQGLYEKFSVRKLKRIKKHGGEHFTLFPKRDVHARAALLAYAASCAAESPHLASDIKAWVESCQ